MPHSTDTFEVNFRFPLRISLAVFVIALGLNVSYFIVTGSIKETLIFVGATTAASGTILAAFYSAKVLSLQLGQNARSQDEYHASISLEKKENSIRYGVRWTDPNMQKPRETCRAIANLKGHSLEETKAALDTEDKKSDVFHLLNYFEEMAMTIKHEMSDEDILRELFSESLIAVGSSLQLWVEDYRKCNELKEAWIEVEALYKSWNR